MKFTEGMIVVHPFRSAFVVFCKVSLALPHRFQLSVCFLSYVEEYFSCIQKVRVSVEQKSPL